MKQYWQEILPIDKYIVSSNGLLHDYDRKPLVFLYQPLIGSTCISLYMTLWTQLEENRLVSSSFTHHMLMNLLDMNLKAIYDARLKLEGIGLLKTFVETSNDERSFIYELSPPLSPEQFFLDGMLNVYLYGKIGRNQYMRIKRFFSEEQIKADGNYENITKSFEDIFSSASFQYSSERLQEETNEKAKQLIGRQEQESIQINQFHFDFDLLLAGIKDSLIPREAFTQKVREAIIKLSFLYGIEPIQMTNIVISAINANNEIDIEELRKSARDWYQFENEEKLPVLVDNIQPLIHHTKQEKPTTKEEKLIYYLETTSPRQLLTDLSGGAQPSNADLKIVEDIMFHQKLLPGVVNVLLQYVMLKTDMKLTKAYVEKIASHWARKKIVTVKEAMDVAINEHRQYVEWAEGNKKRQNQPARNVIRSEKLPDWFVKQKEAEAQKPEQKVDDDFDFEAEKRRLEEKFKKYKK